MKENSLNSSIADSLANHYITFISITQSVVAGFLVAWLLNESFSFFSFESLKIGCAFVALSLVWAEYYRNGHMVKWKFSILDTFIPFFFLVAQIFTIQSIFGSSKEWMMGNGMIWVSAILAYAYMEWRMSFKGQPYPMIIPLLKKQLKIIYVFLVLAILASFLVGKIIGDKSSEIVLPILSSVFFLSFLFLREFQFKKVLDFEEDFLTKMNSEDSLDIPKVSFNSKTCDSENFPEEKPKIKFVAESAQGEIDPEEFGANVVSSLEEVKTQ